MKNKKIMESFIKKIVMVVSWLSITLCASAYDFVVDGIYYNIISSTNMTVEVTYKLEYDNEYYGDAVIPESVTYSGDEYSVTSIGRYAFRGCRGLTSIEIPNSVTSIGDVAFAGCRGLTSIEIPNSVTSIGYNAFSDTEWFNNQPDGIIYLDNYCLGYKGEKPQGNLKIKENTLLIADRAFERCFGLTSVEIPNSVTSIGDEAFYYCYDLTSVEIPNSVTSIGDEAFYYCYDLTSVEIPNSVISIGTESFRSCDKLVILRLGTNLKIIKKNAFLECSNIKKIECLSLTPPEVDNEGQFSKDVYQNADLFIPEGSEEEYKYAYAWSEFKNRFTKDFSGVENVEAGAEFGVAVNGNEIYITGFDGLQEISIYNMSGTLVYCGNDVKCFCPASGLYFVKVGNQTAKVLVK